MRIAYTILVVGRTIAHDPCSDAARSKRDSGAQRALRVDTSESGVAVHIPDRDRHWHVAGALVRTPSRSRRPQRSPRVEKSESLDSDGRRARRCVRADRVRERARARVRIALRRGRVPPLWVGQLDRCLRTQVQGRVRRGFAATDVPAGTCRGSSPDAESRVRTRSLHGTHPDSSPSSDRVATTRPRVATDR